jgi:hypothetical protein
MTERQSAIIEVMQKCLQLFERNNIPLEQEDAADFLILYVRKRMPDATGDEIAEASALLVKQCDDQIKEYMDTKEAFEFMNQFIRDGEGHLTMETIIRRRADEGDEKAAELLEGLWPRLVHGRLPGG